jgi:hypothetical protein
MKANRKRRATIRDDASHRVIRLEGRCLLCGRCCEPPSLRHPDLIVDATMFNPEGLPLNGRCRYLSPALPDGKRPCLIHLAVLKGETEEIPPSALEYWNRCCKDWPTYRGRIAFEVVEDLIRSGAFDGCGFRVSREDSP